MSKTSPASSPATTSGVDKRRSTRLVQALPIKVQGVDALREPFTEGTSTVMVSCHGCKYQSRHYVPKGSIVTLEIPRFDPTSQPRCIAGNVIWVQRPRYAREILHIGLAFEVPGNVWDIPSPPEDWFPLPGETMFVIPTPEPEPDAPAVTAAGRVTVMTWDESEIRALSADEDDGHSVVPRPIAATAAAAAAAEGMKLIRQKLDAQLHEVIEQALKISIDHLSETIVQEARKAYAITAEQLDAKIQKVVAEAVNNLPRGRPNRGKGKRRDMPPSP
ncbi:MAG TPA: hypothetical protein VJO53_04185 [Candidatus Acidoferrales bacterium]|nr:hypothetical protein [Candidatus Acidoferrales bacterium]